MNEKKKQEIPIPFKLDDFYTTQEDRDNNLKDTIEEIDISLIDNFKDHPFKVLDNEELKSLKDSIEDRGIDNPAIVRKKVDGRYEMISGHRRKFALSQLGLKTIPCIVKDLTDDEATIIMVDSNLQQRKQLLPSEKAFAYRMKYDVMKHQGKRTDLTSGPMDQKSTAEKIGKESEESEKTVRRLIRLTYLIPKLLKIVDNSELDLIPSMGVRPASEVSYLKENEQKILLDYIDMNLVTPTLEQAQKLKILSQNGKFSKENLEVMLNELKKVFWDMNKITYEVKEEKNNIVYEVGNISKEQQIKKVLYIRVKHKTIDDMMQLYFFNQLQRKQVFELLQEKYSSMWSSVIYGTPLGSPNIVQIALSQLGNVVGEPYWSWYGFNSRVGWCAIFVSWVANQAGFIEQKFFQNFLEFQMELIGLKLWICGKILIIFHIQEILFSLIGKMMAIQIMLE